MTEARRPGLRQILVDHAVILDASFAMQPGFGDFVSQHAAAFQANRILIPRLVVEELNKLAGGQDSEKRAAASQAIRSIKDMLSKSLCEIRHEDSDAYADQVIQRVVEQHMLRRDILVLTNDAPLMRDVRAKLQKESVRTTRSIRVVKLHAATQRPMEFTPSRAASNTDPSAKAKRPRPSIERRAPKRPKIEPFAMPGTIVHGDSVLSARQKIGVGSRIVLQDGSIATLGHAIAEGGEGTLYEVDGRADVCKIYHPQKLTRSKEAKITLMLTRAVDARGVCWPTGVVRDADGVFRGYLMPRAQGRPLGHSLFLPKQFLAQNPSWTRRESVQLVLSILRLLERLYDLNVLIGDINPQNILFTDPANVWIVDCDSFQIEGFPCPVGTVNFSAPEIQGRDFGSFLRTKEHELFAVATLLFMIMFPGKSPYSHTGGEDGATNIRKMEFPYTRDVSTGRRNAPSGVWTCCWSHLSMQLKDAFTRSFDRSHAGQARVTVTEWKRLFVAYQKILSDTDQVFVGPTPRVGYDLSIMPHSKRYTENRRDAIPADGKSDYERLLHAMVRGTQSRRRGSQVGVTTTRPYTPPIATTTIRRPYPTPTYSPPASRRSSTPVPQRPSGSQQVPVSRASQGCLSMLLFGAGALAILAMLIR